MEKMSNRRENVLFRFAKSKTGKFAGIALLASSIIDATIATGEIINKDYNDAKTFTAIGVAELSLGTAIFIARRGGVSKVSTREN